MGQKRMRVLVAYDGSEYADTALDDLPRAGLPQEGELLIATVAGGLKLSPPLASHQLIEKAVTSRRAEPAIELAQEETAREFVEAQRLSSEAGCRVQSYFPRWGVLAEALTGEPSDELIRKAEMWAADLVVVGTQGRSALGRFFLGSVSKKVAEEAGCPVRVGRSGFDKDKDEDEAVRIVVGVDGSAGAGEAVRAVCERNWPAGTEVRVVTVYDDVATPARPADAPPGAAALITDRDETAMPPARLTAERAAEDLYHAGLDVSVVVKEGTPKRGLIEEAQKWEADCVFVGPRGTGRPRARPGLGGVAAGLVTNAPCSVEVVRTRHPQEGREGLRAW